MRRGAEANAAVDPATDKVSRVNVVALAARSLLSC